MHDLRTCPGYAAGVESMNSACGDIPAERWDTFFSQSGFKRLAVPSINSVCTEAVIIVHVKSRLDMINQIKSKREAKPFWWHHRRGRVLDQDGSWWFLSLYWDNPHSELWRARTYHKHHISNVSALFSVQEHTTWRPCVFVSNDCWDCSQRKALLFKISEMLEYCN